MARLLPRLVANFGRYLTGRSANFHTRNHKLFPGTTGPVSCCAVCSPEAPGGIVSNGRQGFHTSSRRLHEEFEQDEGALVPDKKDSGLVSLEDLVFRILKNEDDKVAIRDFFSVLASKGLRQQDPRLKESVDKITQQVMKLYPNNIGESVLAKEDFEKCISENIVLIGRALRNMFIVPDFQDFTAEVDQLYEKIKLNTDGKLATYIPQLARQNPDHWGVSLCTIDGQRHSIGDTNIPFSLQSCSKAPIYAEVLTKHGADYVHRFVGHEPSGRTFNDLCLNDNNKPHNPMNNSGAILVLSLLNHANNMADRFDNIMQRFKEMAGGEFVGFSNATFLSEKESGNRNYALTYLLQEYGCFPEGVNPMETLDLYFQVCSLEVTCESGSVIAATLANGGICPMTGKKVFDSAAVRDALTVMSSCGMYDHSGQFAFKVGMPAKSGVAGGIMVVVPNVMGFMLWSPPLDRFGNSLRGLNFCDDLISIYNFHNHDDLLHASSKKRDPRRQKRESKASRVVKLFFAAYNGDVSVLRQYLLQGEDMEQRDYAMRTALHVGASQGHVEVVRFLLERCSVQVSPKDKWDRTPLDDAEKFGHTEVAEILRDSDLYKDV
ncbi:glutaminase kidney isoform, mitochondrial-like [Asterias rubens]|uniref:glutaminase kidney isoform, mitochondrial-like n=1 Tax=Asterias rubens TaxID=7604 RepID=UPI0014559CD5|nr:glutaminase kidney isoform, mitochondrial-like [Asterias rubens]